jgi:hypothetical protein
MLRILCSWQLVAPAIAHLRVTALVQASALAGVVAGLRDDSYEKLALAHHLERDLYKWGSTWH